jgi:hypothetical protein
VNVPCELCGMESTHEYYFGAELLHRLCDECDDAASAEARIVRRMIDRRPSRARGASGAFTYVELPPGVNEA